MIDPINGGNSARNVEGTSGGNGDDGSRIKNVKSTNEKNPGLKIDKLEISEKALEIIYGKNEPSDSAPVDPNKIPTIIEKAWNILKMFLFK
jgi:hypothetical protein